MCQSPGQRQGKLAASHAVVRSCANRVPEDRYALQGTLLPILVWAHDHARKERPRHDLRPPILAHLIGLLHAQIHVIEFHNDAMWCLLLGISGIRIATLRPNEPPNVPKRAIHQSSLHPLVMHQQHASTLAQVQLMRQSTEFVGVHLLGLHVPLCAFVPVIRP